MKHSLPNQINLRIGLILVGAALLAGFCSFLYWHKAYEGLMSEYGWLNASESVQKLDSLFGKGETVVRTVVYQLEHSDGTEEAIHRILEPYRTELQEDNRSFYALSVVFPKDGKPGALGGVHYGVSFRGKSCVELEEDYEYYEWYLCPMKLQRGMWTMPSVELAVQDGSRKISYSMPFRLGGGAMGVVRLQIPLGTLERAIVHDPELDAVARNLGGFLLLVNPFGKIVAGELAGEEFGGSLYALVDEPGKSEENWNVIQEIYRGQGYRGSLHCPGVLSGRIIVFYCIARNGWAVLRCFPGNWYLKKMLFLLTFWGGGGLGALLLVQFIVYCICRRVTRPLVDLTKAAAVIGRGDFSAAIPQRPGSEEIELLGKSFRAMQGALQEYIEELKQSIAQRERVESELQVAKEIQTSLLPPMEEPFPKCAYFEVDARLRAARQVGGDLYDFFLAGPARLCLVNGDVSDKGVPASLVMAVVQTLQRVLGRGECMDPQKIVRAMNEQLCRNNPSCMFVTYLLGMLDCETGVFWYCNAGHEPFFVLRKGGVVESPAEVHGMPLGVMPGLEYGMSQVQLEAGDTLFFYTDGIPEARNPEGRFLGLEALRKILESCGAEQLSPQGINDRVEQAVGEFVQGTPQFDDATLLAVRYPGVP